LEVRLQLSNTVEYALRAVVWLADNPDESHTSAQIAEATRMPSSYLSKILQGLSRAKIVSGQRGVHGGFTLAHDPDDLSVLDVVNAVEPLQRIHDCPLGIDVHGKNLCNLHRTLDDVFIAVEKAFAQTTIGGMLKVPNKSKPLCGVTLGGKEIRKPRSKKTAKSKAAKSSRSTGIRR